MTRREVCGTPAYAVDRIYLFTWNLQGSVDAYNLAVDHLAQRGTSGLFIACFQELPADSPIARVRKSASARDSGASKAAIQRKADLADLDGRGIKVVSASSAARSLALVHHPAFTVHRSVVDEDNEFVAAVFQLPASPKQVGVVGLHALSQVRMDYEEEQGGSRGLLRHAINELRLNADHTVVLGDFNSAFGAPAVTSWHCFYALCGTQRPHPEAVLAKRRGLPHPALYVVRPDNSNGMGTFRRRNDLQTVDFIAVDKAIHEAARSQILTMVSAESIWDSLKESPKLSDHLPVEGTVDI